MRGLLPLLLLVSIPAQALNVVLIGDSHSDGTFGEALDQKMRAVPGTTLRTEASCGSILRWWYTGQTTPCGYLGISESGKTTRLEKGPTPLLRRIIADFVPELAVIELGSNYLRGYPDATLTGDLERLFQDLHANQIKCLWIGPPDMRKFRKELPDFIPKLRSLVEKDCEWIDSLSLTRYPDQGGDGVHYETDALRQTARDWASGVFSKLLPWLEKR